MNKKKDKFKTTGHKLRLKNVTIDDLDDVYDYETSKNTKYKPVRKPQSKGEVSLKSNLNLTTGRIVEIKTNYSYIIHINNEFKNCFLSGRLKYIDHDSRNPICIGDFVNVDATHLENMRIEEIKARKNSLTRYLADIKKDVTIAANIDYVVIMGSVRFPDFNTGLIDRYICAANIANIPIILCINKIDLLNDLSDIKKECQYYSSLGYKVIYTSTLTNEGISELKDLLKDNESVFVGHSGTGKSSIINAIEPNLNLKIGNISSFNQKGRHTTTYSRMIPWSFGGFLIDTPGVKTFGLSNDSLDKLPSCFPGFSLYKDHCAFANCTHTHEENCAVKDNIEKNIPPERYDSYLRIRGSI